MIPEIGHFALILALLVSLCLGVLGVVGGISRPVPTGWHSLARVHRPCGCSRPFRLAV
jgi:cytochrome c biogenesis factor